MKKKSGGPLSPQSKQSREEDVADAARLELFQVHDDDAYDTQLPEREAALN